jgi:hypothetical protein
MFNPFSYSFSIFSSILSSAQELANTHNTNHSLIPTILFLSDFVPLYRASLKSSFILSPFLMLCLQVVEYCSDTLGYDGLGRGIEGVWGLESGGVLSPRSRYMRFFRWHISEGRMFSLFFERSSFWSAMSFPISVTISFRTLFRNSSTTKLTSSLRCYLEEAYSMELGRNSS